MSPVAVAFAVAVLLLAKTLAGIYLGANYVCPTCGTRREDRHSQECPWKR